MARRNHQIQNTGATPAVSGLLTMPWRDLLKLASKRGIYKRGMGRSEILAALEGE